MNAVPMCQHLPVREWNVGGKLACTSFGWRGTVKCMYVDNNCIGVILAGVFGLIVGSFLNVVHLRFGKWSNIAKSRSRCPHCHHELNALDLVPLISFLMLLGRCRYCKKNISWQYPIVELATGAVTALAWYFINPHSTLDFVQLTGLLLFAYAGIVMVLQDWREMAVSDILFATSWAGAIIYLFGQHNGINQLLLGLVGSSAVLFLLVKLSRERWMGWGDVLLSVPIGLILGWPKSALWLYVAVMIGGIWGVILLALKLKKRTDAVPFIPIMLVAFWVVLLYGNSLLDRWFSYLPMR